MLPQTSAIASAQPCSIVVEELKSSFCMVFSEEIRERETNDAEASSFIVGIVSSEARLPKKRLPLILPKLIRRDRPSETLREVAIKIQDTQGLKTRNRT